MEDKNVYDRARRVVRELVPLLHTIRECDKSLADQLKRAAQSVVLNIAEARGNDAGNAKARFSTACGSMLLIIVAPIHDRGPGRQFCLLRRLSGVDTRRMGPSSPPRRPHASACMAR